MTIRDHGKYTDIETAVIDLFDPNEMETIADMIMCSRDLFNSHAECNDEIAARLHAERY